LAVKGVRLRLLEVCLEFQCCCLLSLLGLLLLWRNLTSRLEHLEAEVLDEGRTDDQHGDQFDGTDNTPAYASWLDAIRLDIASAQAVADLRDAEADLATQREALPDDVVAELTAAIDARRAAILKAKAA